MREPERVYRATKLKGANEPGIDFGEMEFLAAN
jgi:hypothetical protein